VASPYHPEDAHYVAPPPDADCDLDDMTSWRRRELSAFRFHVGGAGRADSEQVTPGLVTTADLGRGPAGFRASAMWLRVGSDDGLAQYSGELTLDLGGRNDWRPVLGAGAGLARVYKRTQDGGGVETSSIGVGLVRVGVEYRVPVESTDTRAGLAVIGVLPAMRTDDASDRSAWLVFVATIGVGF
jgi:hypothetical protein